MTSNVGVYNYSLSNGCIQLAEKYNELYGTNYLNIKDYYSDKLGEIWLDVVCNNQYEGNYNDNNSDGQYNSELLFPFTQLIGKRDINTQVIFYPNFYNDTQEDGYGEKVVLVNSDGSIETVNLYGYTCSNNILEYKYYICGCNEKESISCGCCIDCCKIANQIKTNYENMLL